MTMHREIAFIDNNISDVDCFVAGLRPEVEPVLIDRAWPGLEQIANTLAARSGLSAIHIVAHGAPGVVCLGASPLTPDTIGDRREEIASIGRALN